MIHDVRSAKKAIDSQAAGFTELGELLVRIEQAYVNRTGEFSSIPKERSAVVQRAIDAAADEPGRELLREIRPAPG